MLLTSYGLYLNNKSQTKIYNASLTAVGDLMVHEYQLKGAYDDISNTYNFTNSFEMIKPFLEKSDITIGNLETTFSGEQKGYSYYPKFNTPDTFAKAVKNAGFDILTTANNHSIDMGSYGLERTIDVLDNLNIKHIGTYKSQKDRDNITIMEINNINFAFLAYTYGTNGININNSYSVNIIDDELIKSDIHKAKQKNVDFIIVSLHFGNEYQTKQNKKQIELVNKIINYGADIILGSHPHVIQPMEKRIIMQYDGTKRTTFVIYSLGNFISNQNIKPRNSSVLLNFEFEKVDNKRASIKNIDFIPIWTQFKKVDGKYYTRVIPISNALNDFKMEFDDNEIKEMEEAYKFIMENIWNK